MLQKLKDSGRTAGQRLEDSWTAWDGKTKGWMRDRSNRLDTKIKEAESMPHIAKQLRASRGLGLPQEPETPVRTNEPPTRLLPVDAPAATTDAEAELQDDGATPEWWPTPAPEISPAPPLTPPSPAPPRRPEAGALVDAPEPARFKCVYPPKPPRKAGGSWTTCVTLHGVSTSAGSHSTKAAAARAVDALLLAHGKPAVNFPGEEEASKVAFPDIGARRRPALERAFVVPARPKAPPREAKAPQSRPKPRRAPKPAPRKKHRTTASTSSGRGRGGPTPHTPSDYTGVHGTERQGAATIWKSDISVDGARHRFEHATEREAAISYDAVRVMYRGEARLNFPERWPGDDSSRYAGVARNADAVTTRALWSAHHNGRELGSFDDEKVAVRVYDFARRCKGQPVVNFDGRGEDGETFCAYLEDWEVRAMREQGEASLVKKYGCRFFEDPDHPGEVYVVHTGGVQWNNGAPTVRVNAVGPTGMRPGQDVEEGAITYYLLNGVLRKMIAATSQGLMIQRSASAKPAPQPKLAELREPATAPSLFPAAETPDVAAASATRSKKLVKRAVSKPQRLMELVDVGKSYAPAWPSASRAAPTKRPKPPPARKAKSPPKAPADAPAETPSRKRPRPDDNATAAKNERLRRELDSLLVATRALEQDLRASEARASSACQRGDRLEQDLRASEARADRYGRQRDEAQGDVKRLRRERDELRADAAFARQLEASGDTVTSGIRCTSGRPDCRCQSGRTRAIVRYNMETGEDLEEYCSGADAALKLDLDPSCVSHVLTGRQQDAGGHAFRYKTPPPAKNVTPARPAKRGRHHCSPADATADQARDAAFARQLDGAAPESAAVPYPVDTLVEECWRGGSKYYPALVLAVGNIGKTVNVKYCDDSDEEDGLPVECVRPAGRRLLQRYQELTGKRPPANLLLPPPPPAAAVPAPPPRFTKGSKCVAPWSDGRQYAATVVWVGATSARVEFEDGSSIVVPAGLDARRAYQTAAARRGGRELLSDTTRRPARTWRSTAP